VTVKEGAGGLPIAITTSHRQAIVAIIDRWRVDDEWWRPEPVSRFYFIVILTSGQRLVIYKDLTSGNWYWHRHSSK